MKKRILTSAIAFVAAMSLSVAAFAAAEPGATNGKVEATQKDITAETPIDIKSDLGLTIAGDAGTFAEGVTEVKMDADIAATDNTKDEAAAKTINEAIEKLVKDAKADLQINTKLAISLFDQDAKAIQPAEGKKLTVTVAYDGVSNAIAYVGDKKVEFIKLNVSEDKKTASFDVTHFSDYYMVKVADSVVADLEGKSADVGTAGDTNKPTDDKNKPTGVVLAIVPAAVAAAAVVVSKKRK